MKMESVYFYNYKCFGYAQKPAGFSTIKPINVIVGKNNSGKSHLLQLVKFLCNKSKLGDENLSISYRITCTLNEESLKKVFRDNASEGVLDGHHWNDHGCFFVGQPIQYDVTNRKKVDNLKFLNSDFSPRVHSSGDDRTHNARIEGIKTLLEYDVISPLYNTTYRHLAAERDILPEQESDSLVLSPSGVGATNIIRKFLYSSNIKYPREVIKDTLLQALNDICGNDMLFTEIYAQKHDNEGPYKNCWEIYLGEKTKGLVALSSSGSGLKTILLTLLNLLVIPIIEEKKASQYTFAIEELENNMHPALLRKLLAYVEQFSLNNQISIFLTSHSATTLDFFIEKEHAHLVQVKHDGKFAYTEDIVSYINCKEILHSLGVKASDLLQTNGIIWVEGPSDRIILNQWIKLFSNGTYEEGRHYQCAFYGGSLLSNIGIESPLNDSTIIENDFVNLLSINSNTYIICDSDRGYEEKELKARVKRIINEAKKLNIPVWVLKAREIENYYPGKALQLAYNKKEELPDPEKNESFFNRKKISKKSYSEIHLKNKSLHRYKADLASRVIPFLSREMMKNRFDWENRMVELIECIKQWNM